MHRLCLQLQTEEDGIVSTLRESQGRRVAQGCAGVDIDQLRKHRILSKLRVRNEVAAAEIEEIGRILAVAALPDSVGEAVARGISSGGVGLSMQVPGDLEELPWEFMFLDDVGAGFLALHPAVRFSRCAAGQARFEQSASFKALVLCADPETDRYRKILKAEHELAAVRGALSHQSSFDVQVETLPHATAGALKRILGAGKWDLFHFIGHGEFLPSGGVLIFEGASLNETSVVYGDELSTLLLAAGTKLVVLSGCQTAGSLATIGGQLAKAGIPAVVGMQTPVSDTVAHLFARTLYAAITQGLSTEEAVFEARAAISGSGQDWGAPVLLTASPATPLLARRPVAAPVARGNLPKPLTSFVGREKEIAHCIELLAAEKCVVLLGSGGIGKTRLSIEIGRAVGRMCAHGVWQVPLDSLTSEEQVLEAIGLTFGIRATVEEKLETRILDFLSDRSLLLILDNCEHLIEPCRAAARLVLEHCPDVKILATSRSVLNTDLEKVIRVPSLSYPKELDDTVTNLPVAATAENYEAVRLLAIRAKSADADFLINESTTCAFARIAKRLDGIPLALELAASRVRTFTPHEILARLTKDLSWLDLQNPGAIPRHKTLRATLEWSYQLLADKERVLFNRLGVFLGGFTLDAAEAVAGFGQLKPSEAPNLVSCLVDKSLVVAERIEEKTRYRLLDTCRHFALERLADSGEEAETRSRHFSHTSSFVALAYPAMFVDEENQRRTFRDLALEQDNCLSAIDWAVSESDLYFAAGEMVRKLFYYWYFVRNFKLAKRTIERVLEHRPSDDDRTYLRLLALCGVATVYLGDMSGLHLATRADEIAKNVDAEFADDDITSWLADCAYMAGEFEFALAILEAQLRYRRERGKDEKTVPINTGALLIHRNELDQAEKEVLCFLSRAERLGNKRDIGVSYYFLARIEFLRGKPSFRSMFAEAVEQSAFVNDVGGLGDFLPLASSAFLPDHPETAALVQGFADRLVEESGALRDRVIELWAADIEASTRQALGSRYEGLRKDGRTASLDSIREKFGIFPRKSQDLNLRRN